MWEYGGVRVWGCDAKGVTHTHAHTQSRAVRNAVPNFVWSLKRYAHILRNLNKDSLVNHFAKASSFTTKVGGAGHVTYSYVC